MSKVEFIYVYIEYTHHTRLSRIRCTRCFHSITCAYTVMRNWEMRKYRISGEDATAVTDEAVYGLFSGRSAAAHRGLMTRFNEWYPPRRG